MKRPPPTPPPPPKPITSWRTYVDERFGWSVEYPATWEVDNSCPPGCPAPGEAVSFENPETQTWVIVSVLPDPASGRSVDERLQALKAQNANPEIGEVRRELNGLPALTVRNEQPEKKGAYGTQMESTYIVTDTVHFEIAFHAIRWKLEQMPDYPQYRRILESFRIARGAPSGRVTQ